MTQARPLTAVLFDWRGVLVHDPSDEWWVRKALTNTGRVADDAHIDEVCDGLRRAAVLPEVVERERTCDCSRAEHRAYSFLYFERAGLDEELAVALYDLDLQAENHPFYPDATGVLHALHERGTRVALVSDIHVDLRPEFAAAGVAGCIDAFVLSFEHGVQKPDPRMFELALDALAVDAADALMIGDRASHDGGAVKAGVETWLLPPTPYGDRPRGLDRVLAFVA